MAGVEVARGQRMLAEEYYPEKEECSSEAEREGGREERGGYSWTEKVR